MALAATPGPRGAVPSQEATRTRLPLLLLLLTIANPIWALQKTHDNGSLPPPVGGNLEVEREVLSAIEATTTNALTNVTIAPTLDHRGDTWQQQEPDEDTWQGTDEEKQGSDEGEKGDAWQQGKQGRQGQYTTTYILDGKGLFSSLPRDKNFTSVRDSPRALRLVEELALKKKNKHGDEKNVKGDSSKIENGKEDETNKDKDVKEEEKEQTKGTEKLDSEYKKADEEGVNEKDEVKEIKEYDTGKYEDTESLNEKEVDKERESNEKKEQDHDPTNSEEEEISKHKETDESKKESNEDKSFADEEDDVDRQTYDEEDMGVKKEQLIMPQEIQGMQEHDVNKGDSDDEEEKKQKKRKKDGQDEEKAKEEAAKEVDQKTVGTQTEVEEINDEILNKSDKQDKKGPKKEKDEKRKEDKADKDENKEDVDLTLSETIESGKITEVEDTIKIIDSEEELNEKQTENDEEKQKEITKEETEEINKKETKEKKEDLPKEETEKDESQETTEESEEESESKKEKLNKVKEEKEWNEKKKIAEEESQEKREEKEQDTLETYSQFTQRVNAEKKNDVTVNGHGGNGGKGPKVKSKNYASPDCGSKLMASNPEATHASKVIQSNKDEYMLNKCQDKIWFIIELCESIRPQKFDIANFELFSNLPKEIQVWGGHRYPSREWSPLARVQAMEANRGVQSFRLDTEDFYKYIKVEVLSHYGSEFFCPISLFRIYGLSEFEVIDTIEDQAEEDHDDSAEVAEEDTNKKKQDEGKPSSIPAVLKNMFSGVLDVIKRGYRPNSISTEPDEACYSLHPNMAVDSALCPMAGSLNYILSCYKMEYEALMQQPFVSSTVKNATFCRQLASTMCAQPEVNDSVVYDTVCNNSYVCVMLSPKHVLAMCFMQDPRILQGPAACQTEVPMADNFSTASPDIMANTDQVPSYVKNAVINTSTITRTDGTDLKGVETPVPLLEVRDGGGGLAQPTPEDPEDQTTAPEDSPSQSQKQPQQKEPKVNRAATQERNKDEAEIVNTDAPKNGEHEGMNGMELEEVELTPEDIGVPLPAPSSTPPPVEPKQLSSSPTNKESVVVRLSNKIKALEYNMSISSQYLEELSRRYKRQMEEMQRQFNLTIAALNDTSRQAYERDQQHQRDIESLEARLENVSQILAKVVSERESLAHTVVEQHLLLMAVEVVVLCGVFTLCYRRRAGGGTEQDQRQAREKTPCGEGDSEEGGHKSRGMQDEPHRRVRRRSVDSITSHMSNRLRQRRPSEEALNNLAGTYQDLLIIEPAIPIMMDSVVDRKKKRKSTSGTLKRSKSNASIVEKSAALCRRARRIEKLNKSSAGVLFCGDDGEMRSTPATPVSTPDTPDAAHIPYQRFYDDQDCVFKDSADGYVFKDSADGYVLKDSTDGYVLRDFLGEIEPGGIPDPPPNKRHSVPCWSDAQQKRPVRLAKSISYDPDREKNIKEKNKRSKKLKRIKDNTDTNVQLNESIRQKMISDDYLYCTANGSYISDLYQPSSVHFSADTKLNGEDTAYNHSYTEYYTNGYDQHTPYTGHDVLYTETRERANTVPKTKGKGKLRSDNWEWYSTQQVGGSSSETISSCSDSSAKGRRPKDESRLVVNGFEGEKKRKKKFKVKSPVLLEEEGSRESGI